MGNQLSQGHLLTNMLLYCFVVSPLLSVKFLCLCGFISVPFLFVGIFLDLWHLYHALNYCILKISFDIIGLTLNFSSKLFDLFLIVFFHMCVRISCIPVCLWLCLASFSDLPFAISGCNAAILVVSSSLDLGTSLCSCYFMFFSSSLLLLSSFS